MSHHHNHHHSKHEAPHSEMVGALIALAVVSIVFNGLFYYSWWANLIKFVLVINLIKEIIHYLSKETDRKSYRYHIKGEDALHLWIATIIVSIVMSFIFNGQWFAKIAPTVLLIKAIETSILAVITKNQDYAEKQNNNSSRVDLYGQAQPELRRIIRVVTTDEASKSVEYNYTDSDSEANPMFCPMCGSKHDDSDRFCPSCGASIRL